MPHWRKFATSFAKTRRYFFATLSILPKAVTLAAKMSYDEGHLVGPRSVTSPLPIPPTRSTSTSPWAWFPRSLRTVRPTPSPCATTRSGPTARPSPRATSSSGGTSSPTTRTSGPPTRKASSPTVSPSTLRTSTPSPSRPPTPSTRPGSLTTRSTRLRCSPSTPGTRPAPTRPSPIWTAPPMALSRPSHTSRAKPRTCPPTPPTPCGRR